MQNTDTTPGVKPNKPSRIHIDIVLSEEQEAYIIEQANHCGMTKSGYLRALGMDYHPKLMMTESQEEAFRGIVDARAELVSIRNALKSLNNEQKIALFKDLRFMKKWISGINTLVRYLKDTMDKFQNEE